MFPSESMKNRRLPVNAQVLCPRHHEDPDLGSLIDKTQQQLQETLRSIVGLAAQDAMKGNPNAAVPVEIISRAQEWIEGQVALAFRTFEGMVPLSPDKSPPALDYQGSREKSHARIKALHSQGVSLRKIVATLDKEGITGPHGGAWYPHSIRRVLGLVGAKSPEL